MIYRQPAPYLFRVEQSAIRLRNTQKRCVGNRQFFALRHYLKLYALRSKTASGGKIVSMDSVILKNIGQTIKAGYCGKALGNTYIGFGPEAKENLAKFLDKFPGMTPYIMPAIGGDIIINIDSDNPWEIANTDYDAAITNKPSSLLVLNAADCIPLVFYSKNHNLLAMAHVGTSGAALHLPRKVIQALRTPAKQIMCYIGPSISQKSYRFEKQKFEKKLDSSWNAYISDEPDGIHINLLGYVLDEVKSAGILQKNIQIEDVDTGGDPNYFSHRRHRLTGEPDGRNCFAVCLNKSS